MVSSIPENLHSSLQFFVYLYLYRFYFFDNMAPLAREAAIKITMRWLAHSAYGSIRSGGHIATGPALAVAPAGFICYGW